MTDTDRMVVWLREAMDAAERDAEAASKDGTPDWYAKEHFAVADAAGEPVVYDEGRPTPDQVRHIVRHDPAAVLRRIAADRQQLAQHAAVPDHGRLSDHGACDKFGCDDAHEQPTVCRSCRNYAGDPIEAPCPTIENLAEGWGWSEGLKGPDPR
jgi:succinylarginine dihydrolase